MATAVKRRLDYTFKYNAKLRRHGWLRLTPAYSVKLVEELLRDDFEASMVLDPFAGTATTGLVAAELGKRSCLYEINPFLIWLGNAKCAHYSRSDLETVKQLSKKIVGTLHVRAGENYFVPKIHNINRWWCGTTLPIIAALYQWLVRNVGLPPSHASGNLLWIAFSRLIIETSSAAFNHVSLSFKDDVTMFDADEIALLYVEILNAILESAIINPTGDAAVFKFDSREQEASNTQYDKVITSPPYPNRISYIRELRPYMYWTGFLEVAREAGELDWNAIGGTWGIATSRLAHWKPEITDLPHSVMDTATAIQNSNGKNAFLMAQYVLKYFHDMYLHFSNLKAKLQPGAKLDYIVGNSVFFGISVPSEKLYGDILLQLGYKNIGSRVIRKRNSKKELFEFDVYAEAPG